MKFNTGKSAVVMAIVGIVLSIQVYADDAKPTPNASVAVDADAAESLARREGCLKCHGTTKDKEGPSFRKVATKFGSKYKDRSEAEQKVLEHIRSGNMVKFSDGEEEEHRIIRSQDESAVMNLIRWILSR